MIAGWLAGKLSGVIIFCMACLMPLCAVGWGWEGVALHGISVPFPVIGPLHLVDGAIHARDIAIDARDIAIHDAAVWQGNADRLGKGLDRCNASVDGLAAASMKMEAAAQALVDQRLAEAKAFATRIAAVNAVAATGEKCPVVDTIFSTGFSK